ncbi:MAG: hypothetical protein KDE32_08535 [Novosphingobium sp.]|nr:hypothetical protein [Novosphingobium sp.]
MASAIAVGAMPAVAALPDQLICKFENVEDLVALPDSEWIIGSGIGNNFSQMGALHVFHEPTATGRKVLLDIPEGTRAQAPYDQCPGPPDPELFSAHGINLKANADGSHDLFVVNHGGRESIEIFRVTKGDSDPEFSWKGCILTPDTAAPNAVAARSDGSIVMSASGVADRPIPTSYQSAQSGFVMTDEQMAKAAQMDIFGAVFTWSRDAGWKKVEQSELAGNNGIELARGGRWAFVNSHPGSSVTLMPLEAGLGKARQIPLSFHPDNIRYGFDGKLVATGHVATVSRVGICFMKNDPHCAIDYRAAEIDPQTLAVTEIFDGTGTRQFGMATIGLKTKDALWLGTARGDCIAKVNFKSSQSRN